MAALMRMIPKNILGHFSTQSSVGSPLVLRRGIASKLFVAGLSFYTSEKRLSEVFSQYGQVLEATVVTDKVSERSKGFGFVTFASVDEAVTAMSEMHGKPLDGRAIAVQIARPRTPHSRGTPIARGPPEPVEEK